jgi:hypothetical protein
VADFTAVVRKNPRAAALDSTEHREELPISRRSQGTFFAPDSMRTFFAPDSMRFEVPHDR